MDHRDHLEPGVDKAYKDQRENVVQLVWLVNREKQAYLVIMANLVMLEGMEVMDNLVNLVRLVSRVRKDQKVQRVPMDKVVFLDHLAARVHKVILVPQVTLVILVPLVRREKLV